MVECPQTASSDVPESINHVLQNFITSDVKTAWHNAPLCNLSGVLQCKGDEVEWESHLKTAEGHRKLDLMDSMGCLALVIDAHITGDNVDMMAVREAKIRKNSDNNRRSHQIKARGSRGETLPSRWTRRAKQEGHLPHVGAGH